MTSLEPSLKTSRIGVLDALRGMAAIVVLWHHVMVVFRLEFQALATWSPAIFSFAVLISDLNKAAVLLFFVLSGFSIRLSLGQAWPVQTGSLAHYALRRAFRILPLYWFALFASWLAAQTLYGTAHPSFSLETLAGNLLFLQTSESAAGNWFAPFGLNGPLWSLSYEVFYYAAFPALAWIAVKVSGAARASRLLVLTCLGFSLAGLALNVAAPSPFSNFMAYWLVWMLGFDLADSWLRRAAAPVFPTAPLALVAVLLVQFVTLQAGLRSDTLEQLRDGVVIAVLGYLAVSLSHPLVATIMRLAGRSLQILFGQLGAGSYALYLLHVPLLLSLAALLQDRLETAPGVTLALAGFVLFGFAVWVCPGIERVFAQLRPTLIGYVGKRATQPIRPKASEPKR